MLGKQKVKYIQSLGQKKFREQEGLFIAEGPKIVKEFLEFESSTILQIFAIREWIENNKHLPSTIEVIEVSDFELEKISQLTTSNKVLAIVKQFEASLNAFTNKKITLVLDTIQDPGNMGTIIRIADWFAIDQVVCSNNCVDIYNPKVVQSTMGSIARVKIVYTEIEKWLVQQKDIPVYAATLDGQELSTVKKLQEGIMIIGNESKGINDEILKLADVRLTISKKGKAESLNAAVAAGIILSHIS